MFRARTTAAVFLLFPFIACLLADDPIRIVGSGVSDYALAEPKVFWHSSGLCSPAPDGGPSFGWDLPEEIRRVASYRNVDRLVFRRDEPRAEGVCNPYTIHSHIIADDDYLYWVDGSGLVRFPTSGNPEDDVETLNGGIHGGPDDRRVELSQSDTAIFARTRSGSTNTLWAVSKTPGALSQFLRSTQTPISQLSNTGNVLYWIEGLVLQRAVRGIGALDPVGIGINVSAYFAEGEFTRLFPTPVTTEYVFYSSGNAIFRRNITNGDVILAYESAQNDAKILDLVTNRRDGVLSSSPADYLYFSEVTPFLDPIDLIVKDLVRLNRRRRGSSGGTETLYVRRQALGQDVISHLTSNGDYVFWQEDDTVQSLPYDAEALPVVDLRVRDVEITQGVQDTQNSVELIQGRRTFVRVDVASEIQPTVENVTATLTLDSPGRALEALVPINSVGTRITVVASPARSVLDDHFLFEIPWYWLTGAEPVTISIDVNPFGIPLENDRSDNVWTDTIEFTRPSPRFEMKFVLYDYELNGTKYQVRLAEDLFATYSWIRRVYPLATSPGTHLDPTPGFRPDRERIFDERLGDRVDQSNFRCDFLAPEEKSLCASIHSKRQLLDLKAERGDTFDIYYGMMVDPPGFFPRGSSSGSVATGPAASPSMGGWDIDTTMGDWYAGHEIAHSLGRGHPQTGADNPNTEATENCGHDPADPGYPYAGANIGNFTNDNYGFDFGDALNARQPLVWSLWTDLMSYCDNQWISDYSYNALYAAMRNYEMTLENPPLGGAAGVPADGAIGVYGLIRLDSDEGQIQFTRVRDRLPASPIGVAGDHVIQLVSAVGAVLGESRFVAEPVDDARETLLGFGLELPFDDATQRVRLTRVFDGAVLDEVILSANAPTVSNVTVQEIAPDRYRVSWESDDADGDGLLHDVLIDRSGGLPGKVEAPCLNADGNSVEIDTLELGGGDVSFRVVASDDVRTGEASSAMVQIPDKPPLVRVLYPGQTIRVEYAQLVNCAAEVVDPQGGSIGDGSIIWRLGARFLGVGRFFSSSSLPIGVNVLRVSAQNSAGLTGSDEVTVIVHDDLRVPDPTLSVGPLKMGWTVSPGTTALQTADLFISNSGRGTISWSATSGASWLDLDLSEGTTPASVVVSADPTGMAFGDSLSAEIVITNTATPQKTETVHVSLSAGSRFLNGGDTAVAARFIRGDANGDGSVNIADPSFIANFLFGIAPATEPPCRAAADTNGDGAINIADPSYTANFVFGIGLAPAPPSPYPGCGPDPDAPGLGCVTPPAVCSGG